jgi:L-fucose isomerase-like protein
LALEGVRSGEKVKPSPAAVGVVTFTDPRDTGLAVERETYLRQSHQALVRLLSKNGAKVVDPMKSLRKGWTESDMFGLRTKNEVEKAIDILLRARTECLIIGSWHWTEPMLPIMLVRELDIPVLLYANHNPTWAGSTFLSSTGASFWENAANENMLRHQRLQGRPERVMPWVRGVTAGSKLSRGSLLLWGPSYCLRMEHLQDDLPGLKSFLVGDFVMEDQYSLIRRAEVMLQEGNRIKAMISWLRKMGCSIEFDDKMLNEESLRREVALYLAAKDSVADKFSEGESIMGASIRCQPELSVDYGVTPCMIPSLLPFPEDFEGEKPVIPVVCEGDIKGLVTCAMLHLMNPEAPPLFGDLKYVDDNLMIISNCGGASIFYSELSPCARECLPEVWVKGQCQGASGGAVGFFSKPSEVTVARLTRIDGEYWMQYGRGRITEMTEEVKSKILWGKMWPNTPIELEAPRDLLISAAGSNHYSATVGDRTLEIEAFCRMHGLPKVRLDSEAELQAFIDMI